MTPEMLAARCAGQSISVSEPIGGARPEWTHVELGFGCHGLAEPYHLAFRWRHGRDGGCYARLRRYLRHEAQRLAWNDRWKRTIAGCAQAAYLEEILNWVMLEEVMSYCDRQRLLDTLEKQWPEGVFQRDLADKQRRVAMILDRWCATAHEHIARRIRPEDEDEFDIVAV